MIRGALEQPVVKTRKGEKGGDCNRTACPHTKNVLCRHKDNGKYYCPSCAHRINEFNPGIIEMPPKETPDDAVDAPSTPEAQA